MPSRRHGALLFERLDGFLGAIGGQPELASNLSRIVFDRQTDTAEGSAQENRRLVTGHEVAVVQVVAADAYLHLERTLDTFVGGDGVRQVLVDPLHPRAAAGAQPPVEMDTCRGVASGACGPVEASGPLSICDGVDLYFSRHVGRLGWYLRAAGPIQCRCMTVILPASPTYLNRALTNPHVPLALGVWL